MPAKVKNTVAANAEAIPALIKRELEKRGRARNVDKPVQQEWKVAGVPGLSLVLKPSGVAIYYVRFMAGQGARRKQIRKAIGHANGATPIRLADARAEALRIATDGAPGYGDDGDPNLTLAALFDKFEAFDKSNAKERGRAAGTMATYRAVLKRDVFKPLGDVPVAEISAKDVAKLLTKVEARSRNSAHKCRAALGALYKWAMKRLLVDSNPMVGMGFSHRTEPRDRKVTDGELSKLWRTIDSNEFGATPAMRMILKIAILTGQRNDEVAGAGRSELHISDAIANPHWHIPARRMKRKMRDQHVFLSDQARALFAEALELAGNSEFVFPAQGHRGDCEHITQGSVSQAWARLRKLAGVEDVHLHDMRKVIASWLGDRGERSDVLDRILHHQVGHHTNQRSSVTESHYNFSVMAGPLRDAWQRWADHVASVVGSARANVIPIAAARSA